MTDLIVALDDPRALAKLPEMIEVGARWFKIDPWLLLDTSSRALATIDDAGASLFLDLKLYQPATTVARTARRAWEMGARLLTVFADSGMLEAASAARVRDDQKVIAVGPLTDGTGSARDLSHQLALCGGVVCRPDAIEHYRRVLPSRVKPVFVCPGVRTQKAWAAGGHGAIFSPSEAARLGATYVVVGRPIYADPARAVEAILWELADAT